MSNRSVAALLAILVLLSLAPATKAASGSNLVAVSLNLDNAIVNQTTNVNLVVSNTGDTAVTTPFTVFFGWNNASSDSDCLTAGSSTSASNPGSVGGASGTQPCYQTVNGLPAQTSRTVSFQWTIPPSKAFPNNGLVGIVTVIENLCTNQGSQQCANPNPISGQPTGPDSTNSQKTATFYKTIALPKVHAYPLRDPRPKPTPNTPVFVNDAWRAVDITSSCQDPPATNGVGCIVMPGHAVSSVYHVTNYGNVADTFTPNVTIENTYTDLGYLVSFAPATKYLNPGESADIVATLYTPPQAPAGQNPNVGSAPNLTVYWASGIDPNVKSNDPGSIAQDCPAALSTQFECQAATLLPIVVGVKHNLNLTTDLPNNYTLVTPGNSTNLDLIVRNTGNAADTYAVTLDRALSSINDSWLPPGAIPQPVQIGPGASFTFKPFIAPPNHPLNVTKGYYTVAYDVQSTSTDATQAYTAKFLILLDQQYALTSQVNNPQALIVPGDGASFSMSVANPGNGPENLTVTVQNQPAGWAWSVSNTTISLPPFGSASLYLNTTAPANVPAGTKAVFYVNVSSNDPADRPQLKPPTQSMPLEVDILNGPNAQLTTPVTSQFIDPGNSSTYTLHVRNVGNEASNFSIVATTSSGIWGATVQPSYLVLSPLNSPNGIAEGDVTVTLRAPSTVQVGDPDSIDHVTLTVTPSGDDGRPKQTVIDGHISGPDFTINRITTNTSTPYGGDPLGITVQVANVGNRAPGVPVTLSVVAIDPTGAKALVANVSLAPTDLRPGSTHDVQVGWDTTGLDGAQTLQATIDPANAVPEIDETNNQASLALVLRTANAIRLLPPQDALSGHPGERVSYTASPDVFQIQYTGNQPSEPVRIQITSANGWVAPDKATVNLDLPRLNLLPLPIDLTIPVLPGTSTDQLTVTVVPVYRPNAVVSATIVTSVIDDAPPQINAVSVDPATLTLGQNATIYASLTDATGVSTVRANVISPSGDVQSLLMLPQPDGRYAVTQSWLQAGTFAVTLVASDNAVPTPNTNDTHRVLATFTVSPGSQPVIALAPGQATIIHTGSAIALTITDPLGIAKANYTVGPLTYDMGTNYTIDTSNFKAGSVDVLVSAQNLYHVTSTARFTFTVDNTPPSIHGVTVSPSAPKAGQDTLIHIETDSKATSVQVQIKKDGQVIQTVQAIRKGPGIYEVTLNPDVGSYTVDVVAQDAAGNTRNGEVLFGAKTSNALPGPELGLVIGALVALALAGRRPRP